MIDRPAKDQPETFHDILRGESAGLKAVVLLDVSDSMTAKRTPDELLDVREIST